MKKINWTNVWKIVRVILEIGTVIFALIEWYDAKRFWGYYEKECEKAIDYKIDATELRLAWITFKQTYKAKIEGCDITNLEYYADAIRNDVLRYKKNVLED